MKKRSMLAFASLAVGVVASLTAPSAHAVPQVPAGPLTDAITAPDLPLGLDRVETVTPELPDLQA
ncbi:hypothetical protein ACGFX4_07830 [Kitasatospora sp. NPDC048365]